MSETLTLKPRRYDKLGVVHCGVGERGFVAVAGDTVTLAEGESHTFPRTGITVTRKGDEYTFTRSVTESRAA